MRRRHLSRFGGIGMVLTGLLCLLFYFPVHSPAAGLENLTQTQMTVPESVLVIYSGAKQFNDTIKGIEEEVAGEFTVQLMTITKRTSPEDIAIQMEKEKPKAVVLMDNQAIHLYRLYQRSLPKGVPVVPAVALMAANVEELIEDMKNAKGFYYQVPAYTSLIHFRNTVETPVRKVGIIHRKLLRHFIEKNKVRCKDEGFEILNIELPNTNINFKKEVKASLIKLIEEEKIDTLWLPNDIRLVNGKMIRSVWLPIANKYKIPVIVGVRNLVDPKMNFGTFAVLPDHLALGNQVGQLLFEAQENDWLLDTREQVTVPLSILKIINYKQVGKRYKVKKDGLDAVDEVLKK